MHNNFVYIFCSFTISADFLFKTMVHLQEPTHYRSKEDLLKRNTFLHTTTTSHVPIYFPVKKISNNTKPETGELPGNGQLLKIQNINARRLRTHRSKIIFRVFPTKVACHCIVGQVDSRKLRKIRGEFSDEFAE